MVILNAFSEWHFSWLDNAPTVKPLSVKKPGCLGWGNATPSLANRKTTDDISGLSSGNFWTHNKPTWIHLRTWDSTKESSKHVSISSRALPSFHSNHAWKYCSNHAYILKRVSSVWRRKQHSFFLLTCPIRLWRWPGWRKPLFILPLTISTRSTPRLKTSDFIEIVPSLAYSGDI